MANDFYTHGSVPAHGAQGRSSEIRNEFEGIEAGFDGVQSAIDGLQSSVDAVASDVDDLTPNVASALQSDGSVPFSGNQNANNKKIVSLANGSSSGDAVNLGQVSALISGGHAAEADLAHSLSPGVALSNLSPASISFPLLQGVSATSRILGRRSSGSGVVEEITIEQALNMLAGTLARGDIIFHNGSNFVRLAAGATGLFLKTNGTSGDPIWASVPFDTDSLKTNLNVSGSAPMFACRAWVRFDANSGAPTILGGGNVSSVTDLGVGNYRINFSVSMPTSVYSVVGSAKQDDNSVNQTTGVHPYAYLATSVCIKTNVDANADSVDPEVVNVAIFC